MQFIRAITICGIFIGIGAMVSMLFSSQAAAQYEPTAATRTLSSLIQVAENPADRAFKNMLIKNSPWSVTWERVTRSGTHKINFAFAEDGTTLTGGFFDSSSASRPGPMKNIVLKVNDGKNCIHLVSSMSDNEYDYCLQENGTLTGTQRGWTSTGNPKEGTVIARPALR